MMDLLCIKNSKPSFSNACVTLSEIYTAIGLLLSVSLK